MDHAIAYLYNVGYAFIIAVFVTVFVAAKLVDEK